MVYSYIIANSIVLGLLISKFNTIKYVLLLLPHGISEIYGFLFLSNIILNILHEGKFDNKYFKKITIAYIIIILSALIEAFITPLFIKFI